MCHAYCLGQNTRPKFPRFQLAQNKTFCPTQHPSITDNSGTVASLSLIFHKKFTVSVLKNKQVFHPNSKGTRSASVRVFNWVSKFYAPTEYEHKFHKTGIEVWLPIGFNLAVITTALC